MGTADNICGKLGKSVEVWGGAVCVLCTPMWLGSEGTDFAFTMCFLWME